MTEPLFELPGYFKKLDLEVKWDRMTQEACKGNYYTGYGDIKYYDCKPLRGVFSAKLIAALQPEHITWVEVEGPGHIYPHRDKGIICAINFYKVAADCDTTFFEPLPGREVKINPNLNDARIIQPDEVEALGTFTAKDCETYLLNVSKIHDVVARGELRQFIQFNWHTKTYATILARLQALAES